MTKISKDTPCHELKKTTAEDVGEEREVISLPPEIVIK